MTEDELRIVATFDARAAYASYDAMRTEELLRLQIDRQIQQAHATTPEEIAFGAGRLALIAAVLKKRADADPRD